MTNNVYEKPGTPLNVGALLLAAQLLVAAGTVGDNVTSVICDATTATFVATLPLAALNPGRVLVLLLNVTGSSHTVTVTPAGSDTVGGTSTKSLSAAGKFAVLQAVANDWVILLSN